MNERLHESLSALLDDEANELEVERILRAIGEDEELRRVFTRYSAARGALLGAGVAPVEMDISRAVGAALESESARGVSALGRSLLRPVTSFAVAASVALAVVVGGQQLAATDVDGEMQPVATTRPSPVIGLNIDGRTVPASYGYLPLPELERANGVAYRKLAAQRMGRYMQEHAEHAALNSPQGLMPFARVRQIEE